MEGLIGGVRVMADYFDYDEIYGIEGQADSVYDPNCPDEEEEEYWGEPPEPPIKASEHGYYAPAYRRDLSIDDMINLRIKGFSY